MGTGERLGGERDRHGRLRRLLRWALSSYVVLIALGIVVGMQVAPVVSDVAPGPSRGTVAVVPLQGGIDGGNAASVVSRLDRARENPGVDAVVLLVNSGGGGAAASEEIYMAVRRTAKQKPVVASVGGIAASGAYYAMAPADLIVVKPSSFVGSVGVTFVAPADTAPLDRHVITGPNKLTGADLREWQYKIEAARRAFAGAVVDGRGDALSLTTEELSYAKLYTGSEGVDNGLADRIGDTEDAIRAAAAMADVSQYRTTVMGYQGTVSFVTQRAYVASPMLDKELVSPATFVRDPRAVAVPNPLMLPASVVRAGVLARIDDRAGEPASAAATSNATGPPTEVTASADGR